VAASQNACGLGVREEPWPLAGGSGGLAGVLLRCLAQNALKIPTLPFLLVTHMLP